MFLETLEVEGFKSIRRLSLQLRPLNVLVGANGAGKSNLIEVFRLLNAIVEKRLGTYTGRVGADALLHHGQKTTPVMRVQAVFSKESNFANGYEAFLQPSNKGGLRIDSERTSFHDRAKYQNPRWDLLSSGRDESVLHPTPPGSRRTIQTYVLTAMVDWKVYHFHDTSASALVKQQSKLNDNERLREDASNLAAYLYLLQQTQQAVYQRIVETVRLVAPFFDDFVLRPNPLNPNTIRLEWREVGSDAYFDAHMLSDGTLRFICLATLLLQHQLPSVVLVDEPELGLHPYAIVLLAGLLRSAAAHTQVIVSTQSVPLVSQFDPDNILVVDREDGQSVFRWADQLPNTNLDAWLEDYTLGELWEKNILGGRPRRPEARP